MGILFSSSHVEEANKRSLRNCWSSQLIMTRKSIVGFRSRSSFPPNLVDERKRYFKLAPTSARWRFPLIILAIIGIYIISLKELLKKWLKITYILKNIRFKDESFKMVIETFAGTKNKFLYLLNKIRRILKLQEF